MIRFITRWCALGVLVGTAASPAFAQVPARPLLQATPSVSSVAQGEIRGIVEDDKGQPLAGAVVSALGATTLFARADRRRPVRLPQPGARALSGSRASAGIRARAGTRRPGQRVPSDRVQVLSLTRTVDSADAPTVLTAGVGGAVADRRTRRARARRACLAPAPRQAQRAEGRRTRPSRSSTTIRSLTIRCSVWAGPSAARRVWRRRSSPIFRSTARSTC